MKTLAQRIKSSRQKSGLSQVALAKQTQLTQQMISKLESGTSQSTSAILSIARALNVSAHWLWLGNEEPPSGQPMFNGNEDIQKAWRLLTNQQRAKVCEYILKISKNKEVEEELREAANN